ncbi:MBL fold metallo-hydrolase [Evansella tamaricis]|uniref:MBL fold metallo-hydrolase n=1 Tax=Evansella tamaricis TaxID=2069301 RepID=A0ABS6J9S7_9BACI|nr:MBL fold metallo-hydrolase [Evansella tamaricis]MBU9710291.1 MBL fold metallo-hydrolase [Evansella tamaricis]
MKLTVIGYWGAYPEKNEATSCYLLQDENTNILLDCGSGAVAQLQNYIELAEIDAVIITHYHHDHIADLGVLTYSRIVDMNLGKTDRPLHIFAHDKDAEAFQQLSKKPFAEAFAYHAEKNGMPFTIGSLQFTFHPTNHPVPCFAVKAHSQDGSIIAYTGDTAYDESLIPFLKNVDLLITESSFYEGQDAKPFGHMNSKESGILGYKSNVKYLLLSHLPHFGNHQQLITESCKYYSGKISHARGGMVWTSE